MIARASIHSDDVVTMQTYWRAGVAARGHLVQRHRGFPTGAALCRSNGQPTRQHPPAGQPLAVGLATIPPYEQGQYVGEQREYFYFIDHNGNLFLDDARMKNFTSCFKGAHGFVVNRQMATCVY